MKQRLQLKKFNRLVIILIMLTPLGSVLFGCSDSGHAPSTAVAPAQQPAQQLKTQGTITQIPVVQPPEYSYNAQGRRDPFASIIVKEEIKEKDKNRPPLERYSVSEFKLAGIVWGGFGYNAMLEGPDGKGYFVRVGTIVGPNKGVVKNITQNAMVVEEKFKTFSGEIERKEIVIELRKKEEGMQ